MTAAAPAFTATHRTVAGPAIDPISKISDDTWIYGAIATITTANAHGTGSNLRVRLGLTADNGATAVGTIDADHLPLIPDFLRTPGARVEVRGIVRHMPGGSPASAPMPVIEIVNVTPV